jgi:hypothetical protein
LYPFVRRGATDESDAGRATRVPQRTRGRSAPTCVYTLGGIYLVSSTDQASVEHGTIPSSQRRNRESCQVHVVERRTPCARTRRTRPHRRRPSPRRRLVDAVSHWSDPPVGRSIERVLAGSAGGPAPQGSIEPCQRIATDVARGFCPSSERDHDRRQHAHAR